MQPQPGSHSLFVSRKGIATIPHVSHSPKSTWPGGCKAMEFPPKSRSISNSRSTCSRMCQEVATVVTKKSTAGHENKCQCEATYARSQLQPVQQLQSLDKVYQQRAAGDCNTVSSAAGVVLQYNCTYQIRGTARLHTCTPSTPPTAPTAAMRCTVLPAALNCCCRGGSCRGVT